MLNNLKAELVRKGFNPVSIVAATLGCNIKTARNKINGISDFKLSEAIKIKHSILNDTKLDMSILFTDSEQQSDSKSA